MPIAEEDHDHDLSRYTRRCFGHHRRWILWTVNAAIGKVDTRRCGVRKREPSAALIPRRIGPKRWTRRTLGVERSSPVLFEPRRQQQQRQQQQQQQQHHRWKQQRQLDRNARQPIVSASILHAASSTDLSFTRATPRSTDRRPIPPSVAPSVRSLSRYQGKSKLESPLPSVRPTTAPTTRKTKNPPLRCCRDRCRRRCRCSLTISPPRCFRFSLLLVKPRYALASFRLPSCTACA